MTKRKHDSRYLVQFFFFSANSKLMFQSRKAFNRDVDNICYQLSGDFFVAVVVVLLVDSGIMVVCTPVDDVEFVWFYISL